MPATTRQVAKLAGIGDQTLRNWTDQYGELLSPLARGDSGPRLFNDEDVQVICSIATLRRDGIPPVEVIERLGRGDVYIEATPNSPQTTPSATQASQTALVAPSSVLARLDALERTQRLLLRAAVLWGALWGAVAALALGGFVLWALYLWGG